MLKFIRDDGNNTIIQNIQCMWY